jgi:hypothetical protein
VLNDFSSEQNDFAGRLYGSANVQNGDAGVRHGNAVEQNDCADLQYYFAGVKNGFAGKQNDYRVWGSLRCSVFLPTTIWVQWQIMPQLKPIVGDSRAA